jgi:hypothetical protein
MKGNHQHKNAQYPKCSLGDLGAHRQRSESSLMVAVRDKCENGDGHDAEGLPPSNSVSDFRATIKGAFSIADSNRCGYFWPIH